MHLDHWDWLANRVSGLFTLRRTVLEKSLVFIATPKKRQLLRLMNGAQCSSEVSIYGKSLSVIRWDLRCQKTQKMRCARTDKIESLKSTVYPILDSGAMHLLLTFCDAFYICSFHCHIIAVYTPRVFYVYNPFQDVQDLYHYHSGHALRHGRHSPWYALLFLLVCLC